MSDELEIGDVDLKVDDALPLNLNLGEPDLSSFIDDDEIEITSKDVSTNSAKAQKMLKPSFMIEKLMPMLFSVVARVKGDRWNLEAEEVELFAEAVDECVDHYYPDMGTLPPWAMLAFSSGMIVLPRLMMDGMSDDQKKMASQELEKLKGGEKQVGHNTVLRPSEG